MRHNHTWTPAQQRVALRPRNANISHSQQVLVQPMMTKLKPILDGGRYFEGPRWHLGRLWFVDCMERTLLSLGPSGACEQHAKFEDDVPCGLGVLPDGRIIVLTMFRKRLMTYADGQLSLYADLSGIAK